MGKHMSTLIHDPKASSRENSIHGPDAYPENRTGRARVEHQNIDALHGCDYLTGRKLCESLHDKGGEGVEHTTNDASGNAKKGM